MLEKYNILQYNCKTDGELFLYNSLGQQIFTTSLLAENRSVVIPITNIAVGTYHYRCIFSGCANSKGLLNIIK